MKHLLLTCLLLWSIPGLAQRATTVRLPAPNPSAYSCAEPTGSMQRRADSLLAPLNKNQVPTAILYDRVFPLARLDAFGQTGADTSRFEHLLQAS